METSVPLLSSPHDVERRVTFEVDDLPVSAQRRRALRRPPFGKLGTTLGVLTGVGMLVAVVTLFWSRGYDIGDVRDGLLPLIDTKAPPMSEATAEHVWKDKVAQWVNGEPTEHFQDNLRPDMQYVTTWIAAGWTNDFMTYINMVYLALITSRIPVIPPFAPSHVAWDAGFPAFSDIFDVPRFAEAIGSPVLEWRDVKQENSTEFDELGCWSVWGLVGPKYGDPRGSAIPSHLKLDIAYTTLPKASPVIVGSWVPFWSLAKLSFASWRTRALAEHPPQLPTPRSHVQLVPDERLLCFDFMYYIGAQDHDEWWQEWSPAWRLVGRYARWGTKLEKIAVGYIQRALEVVEGEVVPLYIGIHVRRGDFTAACGGISAEECFTPLAAYARHVASVNATLSARSIELPAHHVLVTSDEKSAEWWAEVKALGWRTADHAVEQTEEKYGKWYPALIDAVVQSLGVGFVGTDRSTMSLVAKRRVEDWNGGVGDLVKLGKDAQ